MDNIDLWKKDRLVSVKEFMGENNYILLRGTSSWSKKSDVDILSPTFKQESFLKRYNYKDVKIDLFKRYMIKNIEIDYNVLNKYKKSDCSLDFNIEAMLFFAKDYLHFSKFRKHKHIYYKNFTIAPKLNVEFGIKKSIFYFLKPSSNWFSFYCRSLIVKFFYYIN